MKRRKTTTRSAAARKAAPAGGKTPKRRPPTKAGTTRTAAAASAASAPASSTAKAPPVRAGRTAVDGRASLEDVIKGVRGEHYVLRLYVTGNTARSAEAVANVRALCDEHLPGRYELEVIDIYQQPAEAQGAQIIAAPTLVKKLPSPPRRMIGNLNDRERVLVGLDIRADDGKDPAAARPRETGRVRWVEV